MLDLSKKITYNLRMKMALIYLLGLVLIVGLACSEDNPVDNDPEEPEALANKVWINYDSDTLTASNTYTIDVYFENNEPLLGLVIPMSFEGDNISIDSISLIGSRFEDFAHKGFELSNDEQNFLVYAYSTEDEILDTASGLGFTIYLWVWGNAPDQEFSFDSTFIAPASHLQFMNEQQQSFTPEFETKLFQIKSIQ